MNSLRNWVTNLFEAMAIAFIHPINNSLPPNIGTHPYSQKPYKNHKKVWYG